MSLITRCPACQTLFKVVPDQLRLSEGWARCGQCDGVFDASLHLLQEPQVPQAAPPAREAEAPEFHQQTPSLPLQHSPEFQQVPEPVVSLEPEPIAPPQSAEGHNLAGPVALPEVPHEPPPFVAEPVTAKAVQDEVQIDPEESREKTLEAMSLPSVSFMREMPQHSAWHRAWVRGVLGFASLVLLVGLAAQVMLHERDRVAALLPDARPLLVAACDVLGCRVSPLRQIDSIVIDNSSFNRLRGDAYRLGLVVKNTAAIELAMPALELTLTDAQDQAIVRRVLLPADWGAASDVLGAGSDLSSTVSLSVRNIAGAERIAGYRVLAFYP